MVFITTAKIVAATVETSHSLVTPVCTAFLKDWYTEKKGKEAAEHAKNVVSP